MLPEKTISPKRSRGLWHPLVSCLPYVHRVHLEMVTVFEGNTFTMHAR